MKLDKYFIVLLIIPFGSVLCEITAEGVAGLVGISVSVIGMGIGIFYIQQTSTDYCNSNLKPHDLSALKHKLNSKLFGQHIIQENLNNAIVSHFQTIHKSKKPLVMSFHGSPGTGKNYVSSMIAETVFRQGMKSEHVHVFRGSQFSNRGQIEKYKQAIMNEIADGVKSCPYSIFVFDEVEKMPPGIFDSITAFLDHHSSDSKKDFTKSIFLFLSNHGGDEIIKILHELTTKKGFYRHETKLHHFEEIMKFSVKTQTGGLKDSQLIKSEVVDFYFPFLPLEKPHITQCIIEEFKFCDTKFVTQDMVDKVMRNIGFNKVTNYANAGCKTIYHKVQVECPQ